MELVELMDQTFRHAQEVISGVRTDQYDDPTPCAEWTVRDLLSHMIGVVVGIGSAARGERAGAAFELGDDPGDQFAAAAAAAIEAWRAPGVLDRTIDAGPGPMPGRVLAGIQLLDTATHTWDLATATGQPATLPEPVAEAALELSLKTISPEIRPGRFDPEITAPEDAGVTERLVAYLGRRP